MSIPAEDRQAASRSCFLDPSSWLSLTAVEMTARGLRLTECLPRTEGTLIPRKTRSRDTVKTRVLRDLLLCLRIDGMIIRGNST